VEARERIQAHIRKTDITQMSLPGGELYLKLENLQATGAYKVRGAFNCMLQLSEEQKHAGVIAASAGNHAQGVARAARELGVHCAIVMPAGAPLSKVAATKHYGAHVTLSGNGYDEAYAHALALSKGSGATFIHPFDDERVIAGQGTIALEIIDAVNPAQIIVPIGGGGLAAGVATAAKGINPQIRVIGVEPANAASMKASIAAGRIITLISTNTIADGIAVKTPGDVTYPICRDLLDDIVTVGDDEIAQAILHLLEKGKIVSEGAGAAAIAAVLNKKIALTDDGPTVAILSGGNIDVNMISRIINKGLLRTGRMVSIHTLLSDKPGQLAMLLSIISGTGANILTVQHDRISADMDITQSAVAVSVETRNNRHVFEIRSMLEDMGYRLL
jgi:threonine dehydratase